MYIDIILSPTIIRSKRLYEKKKKIQPKANQKYKLILHFINHHNDLHSRDISRDTAYKKYYKR